MEKTSLKSGNRLSNAALRKKMYRSSSDAQSWIGYGSGRYSQVVADL